MPQFRWLLAVEPGDSGYMRVEFYLIDAMEVLHFAPVLRALERMNVESTFVSSRSNENVLGGWYDADNAETLMEKLGLPYVPRPNCNADLALTTQESVKLRNYRKLRARMNYGPMLTATFEASAPSLFAQAHRDFDLYLLHGPFNRRMSTRFVRDELVRTIGYPRFDVWFNNPPDRRALLQKYEFSGSRPIILYLPTWEHRSSIDEFADAVFALSDRFDIAVKPHHCTFRTESRRMEKLKSGPVRLLTPLMAPEEAYCLADIVIADASSGTLAESILLRKPIVSIAGKGELKGLLLPDLSTQIPFCLTPDQLAKKVEEASALDVASNDFGLLRQDLFDTSEGNDGVRAAEAIYEFVEQRDHAHWSRAGKYVRWRKRHLRQQYNTAARRIRHPVRTVRNGLRRIEAISVPVLLYHNVGPVPAEDPFNLTIAPEQFELQMQWLIKNGYQTITSSDWQAVQHRDIPFPRRPVMITFDDGYADIAEFALPVLRHHGLKAAVYVVTHRLGLTNSWDEENGYATMRLLSGDQVRYWAEQGIEFGSHTRTHPHLGLLSAQQLSGEINGSKEDLRNLLGTEVFSFAYPYGEGVESTIVRRYVRDNFQLGLTVRQGLNSKATSPYELRRSMILPDDTLLSFRLKLLMGRVPWDGIKAHLTHLVRSSRSQLGADRRSGSEELVEVLHKTYSGLRSNSRR